MSVRRLSIFLSLAFLTMILVGVPIKSQYIETASNGTETIISGRNVNMVSGDTLPGGDPWLQRQNEPSIAVSSRNPLHLLAGANDYRTVDMPISEGELPGKVPTAMVGDAWLGVFTSYDGGESWTSTMLPGYPQDPKANPLKGYRTAADPVVRSGPNGLFYYSGIAFNRDTNLGVVFVARFIDNNNKEGGDAIQYIDTKIIAKGTATKFLDKPWIAVDQPRAPMTNITIAGQTFPRHNVYIAYGSFSGTKVTVGDITFARSTDCGGTWGTPIKISAGNFAHQGATIAIKPVLGEVLVAYRRFAQTGKSPDQIYVAQSFTRGASFQSPIKVADVPPFDQPTTDETQSLPGTMPGPAFRANSYPTMAVDKGGHVYLAWSQRGVGAGGGARIMLSSSHLGTNWTLPQPIDPNGLSFLGHQIMPSLSFAASKLIMVWYDQRNDVSGEEYGFNNWILDDQPYRHTMDVWAAEADTSAYPNLVWNFTQVSRYLYSVLKDESGNIIFDNSGNPIIFPVQFNCVNYQLFKGGHNPFIGDYIDVAASPSFRLDTWKNWIFNTDSANSPVFHVAWTDNRDVRPPLSGDWTQYTPASSTQDGSFITPGRPECSAGGNAPGMRNQNIYTSRVTWGIEAGSPTNDKPLNLDVGRAFVVFVKNNTEYLRSFRLTIASQPAGGQASFLQFELLATLDVNIAPYSTISRPVFVNSSDINASVTINIDEIDASGNVIAGGLKSSVLLNGDPSNPNVPTGEETHNPNIVNQANPNIVNWYVNPNIVNPNIVNPNIVNPNIVNPNIVNPNIVNPNIVNPNIVNQNVPNPNIVNPNIVNPNIVNPNIVNAGLEDLSITDVEWTVTNDGNTTTSFTVKALAKKSPPEGVYAQLLVYRVHYTPAVAGAELGSDRTDIEDCQLKQEPHHELILNIVNPNIVNPNIVNPNIVNPNIVNSSIENATFPVAPGEEVIVDLRVLDTGTSQIQGQMAIKSMSSNATLQAFSAQDFIDSLGFAVTSQAVDSDDAAQGIETPAAAATELVIGTASLPDGVVGYGYTATLMAYGGTGLYIWTLNSGELPPGLALGAGGVISGTPTTAGTYYFIVRVDDSGGQFDTQQYSIYVNSGPTPDPLNITTTSLPSGVQGHWYGATLEATGGVWPRTWSLASGSLPAGLSLDSGGVISGTPTAEGTSFFTVRVTDKNGTIDTQPLSILIGVQTSTYYVISGTVYDEYGYPLGDVVLRGLPNTPTTDSYGNYHDNVPEGWSGTVTPFKAGHTFSPSNRTYSELSSNQTGQDYNIGYVSPTISGTVLLGGSGLAGVVMNGLPGPPSTNTDGFYTATVTYGWSGTVTPELTGYTFTPPSQSYTKVTSNQTTYYTAGLVVPPASKLVFTQSPNGGVGGAPWTVQPIVEVQDAGGNRVTSDNSTEVTLELLPANYSPQGPRLSGTTSLQVSSGVATFNDLSVDKGGYGYTLEATSNPELQAATSESFSIEGFSYTLNSMGVPRFWHTATTLGTDKVLIAGGSNGYGPGPTYYPVDDVSLYDPSTNAFTPLGDMTEARFAHTATALPDGTILITGGGSSISRAILFRPSTNDFISVGNMNYPRIRHRATLLQNGRVLITGNQDNNQNTAEIYNPVDGTFTITGNMNNNRNMHTSTLLRSGKVLITGGLQNAGIQSVLSTAELYDPDTGTFTPVGAMAGGSRWNHQATLLDDGRVLVTGGGNADGALNTAEIYNPTPVLPDYPNGYFTSIGNMLYEHQGHQAAPLRDGTVLIIGGNSLIANSEIFDPITSTFRSTGPTSERRNDAASAVLPDGRVLVTGGCEPCLNPEAEVWNPLAPFPTHVISGTITYNAAGVGGVMLVGLPGHPMTNNGGYYEGLVLNGWSGTVTPTKAGYEFSPPFKIYDPVTEDISGENYLATSAPTVPTKLAFGQQPSAATVGATITPAVTVQIQDEFGNVVDNASNTVTLSLLNAGGATLSGDVDKAAVEGVATFSDLSIDQVGTGYQLRAGSGSLTKVNSSAFDITALGFTHIIVETAADGSGFPVPPQIVPAGSSITVYCIGRDDEGNFVANVAAWVWTLINKTDGVVDGDLVPSGDMKSATFTGHSIGTAQISASWGSWPPSNSGVLTVSGGAAGRVDLTGPARVGAGFISEAFTVTSQDAGGNPVNVLQNTVFNLTSNTTGTATFFSDPAGTTPITQVTILSGQSSASFYYMDDVGGTPTVTATWASGGTDIGFDGHQTNLVAFVGQIVFASDSDGNWEIYTMNLDGTGSKRLTDTPANELDPTWSPKGSKIAFKTFRDGNWEIYTINADGSWPTNLTQNSAQDGSPSWSSDGTKIVFYSNRDGNDEIYVMNADGTGQTRLTDNIASDWVPCWSPDGTQIVFQSNRDGNDEIYLMDAGGTTLQRLTSNLFTYDGSPSWSPDGSKIAFVSDGDHAGNLEIYVMNVDGTGQTRLTNSPGEDYSPYWSPDGSKIIFTSWRDANWEIYSMNADGSGQTRLTTTTAIERYPRWGGSQIAFVSDRDGDREIYIMNAHGTGLANLTMNESYDSEPSWSSDGNKIAFTSDRNGNYEIYVMNTDGSSLLNLTEHYSSDSRSSWSPDGTKIAFVSNRNDAKDIFVINSDKTGLRQLTTSPYNDDAPSWSPDGIKIAFDSDRDGYGEIYVMNFDGSSQTNLTNNPWRDGSPSWSPDGSKIAFHSDRASGNFDVYVMSSDGLSPTRLTESSGWDGYPSWSSDGKKVIFTSNRDGNFEIYVMDADGSNETRLTDNLALDGLTSWRTQPYIPQTYEFVTKWGSSGTGDGQFDHPFGIAIDNSGYVYVADTHNYRIQKFTASGGFVGKWGSSGNGDGQFNQPYGVAVDSSGYVYVADTLNNRVQKFSSDGTFVTKWGSNGIGDGQFNAPQGIAVDDLGYIYVVDTTNHRVQKFTSSGAFVTKWGSNGMGDGQFRDPWGIGIASSGDVYVTEASGHRVQKFTSGAAFLGWWGLDNLGFTGWHGPGSGRYGAYGFGDGQFGSPGGISIDSVGAVYVADYGNSRVQKFTSGGAFVVKWGGVGGGNGQFSYDSGVAVDALGYVYVIDTNNTRVQKFRRK